GKRTVIAAVKGIERSDLSTSQHGTGWLSFERQSVTHDDVAALSPLISTIKAFKSRHLRTGRNQPAEERR
ncbi:MAG: hypothetical protein JWR13_3332, partial [Mycobacterium sp.]|nr:hypothetical protein [Mycobacterium sp.]